MLFNPLIISGFFVGPRARMELGARLRTVAC